MGPASIRLFIGICLVIRATPAAEPVSFRAALRMASERAPLALGSAQSAKTLRRAAERSNPLFLLPAQLQVYSAARRLAADASLGSDTQAQFQQYVPLRPVGATRREAMSAAEALSLARQSEARAVAAERAAHAWLDVFFSQQYQALRGRALTEAESLTKLARARVAAGTASANDTALALADEAIAMAENIEAEGELHEATIALGSLIGLEDDSLAIDPSDAPSNVAPVPHDAALQNMRARHTGVLRARAYEQGVRRDASHFEASQGLNVGIGGVSSREGTGDIFVGALVTLPLAWSTPGEAEVLRAEAALHEASAARAFEEEELHRILRLALHEYDHARDSARASLNALRALQEAYRIARALVDRGAVDLSVAALARQRLIAGETRSIRSNIRILHANVRLLAAQGTLPEGSPP